MKKWQKKIYRRANHYDSGWDAHVAECRRHGVPMMCSRAYRREGFREKMKSDIARNTRIAESSRPFMCGLAPECHKCVPVIISDEGTVKPNESKHEIEPSNED